MIVHDPVITGLCRAERIAAGTTADDQNPLWLFRQFPFPTQVHRDDCP
jgi:hypothetical protein